MKNIFSRIFDRSDFSFWALLFFSVLVFLFAIRGLPGNPTAEEMMASEAWRSEGPLELSPERGRFALLYSIVEDESLFFSLPVARLATPDLAINREGKFVSLFAPFLSFLLIPGYFIGKMLGASVLGATAMIGIFAIGNAFLIRAITMRLGAGKGAASLGALAFLFGTPAFAYATTLYQHHVSVFALLLSIYVLLRWRGFGSLVAVSLLAGVSVPLDNPNAILFLPIVLWAITRVVWIRFDRNGAKIFAKPAYLLSGLAASIPFGIFFWYNMAVNGGAFQLSGTLPSIPAISADGRALDNDPNQKNEKRQEESDEKTAVGFFKTRNILNGLYIHLVSPDRGVVRYAPVILFGVLGFFLLYRERRYAIANVLVGVSILLLLLYSLWGDPWGGWAFGSRYLIPAYALFAIGVGIALEHWKRSFVFLSVFFSILFFSMGVNTLGALTSSANPPQVQVLELEALSRKEQKYTMARNWQYLQEFGSKSFLYRVWLHHFVSAETYYWMVAAFLVGGTSVCGVALIREEITKRSYV